MAHLIDKDALVAKIKKLKERHKNHNTVVGMAYNMAYNDILSFLDSLEVKEVDLEKEIQDHIKECLDIKFPTTDIELIKKDVAYTAKKFFELGLKAQKGE